MSGTPDPNAVTRTAAPQETAQGGTSSSQGAVQEPRALAPLQYRDSARYEVVGEHGRGGLGRVLRARDRELGRQIAIKELLHRSATSEVRFFQEALITARLEHPGIVPVHEAGRWHDGTPFYAMKLVAGRPLSDLIDEAVEIDERLALLPHVVAVADAISYAHSRGVIHRDLKPSNVMIGSFGETVVIDWGLAKDIGETAQSAKSADASAIAEGPSGGLTAAGSILGTLAYMAPEQVRGQADETSDIFALGMMLFQVFTGQRPAAIDEGTGTRAALSLNDFPLDLAAIIRCATALNPRERYQLANDFSADLRRYLRREPVSVRQYGAVARLALAVVREPRLYAYASLFAVLAIVVLAVALVAVNTLRGRAQDSEAAAREAAVTLNANLVALSRAHTRVLLKTNPTAAYELAQSRMSVDREWATFATALAKAEGLYTRVFRPHTATPTMMQVTPGGNIVSAAVDRRLAVTNAATGAVHVVTPRLQQPPYVAYGAATGSVAYVKDATTLAVTIADSLETRETPVGCAVRNVAISPRGDVVVAQCDSELLVGELRPGTRGLFMRRLILPLQAVHDVFVSSNSNIVVVQSQHVRVFGLLGGSTVAEVGLLSPVALATIDATGRTIALALESGHVTILDANSLAVLRTDAACADPPVHVGVADDSYYFSCRDRTAVLVNSNGTPERDVLALDSLGRVGSHDVRQKVFVVGTDEGGVFVQKEGRPLLRLRGHEGRVTTVAVGGFQGSILASGDERGYVRLWSRASLASLRLMASRYEVLSVAFSPSGDSLLARSVSGKTQLWLLRRGECRAVPQIAGGSWSIAASPDGKLFATLGKDGAVVAWQWTGDNVMALPIELEGPVVDFDFTMTGHEIIAALEDGDVVVWDPLTNNRRVVAGVSRRVSAIERLETGVAVAYVGAGVAVVDMEGNETMVSTDKGPTVLRSSRSGRWLALAEASGRLLLYSVSPHVLLPVIELSTGARFVNFSKGDRYLVAGTIDGRVVVVVLWPWPRVLLSLDDVPARSGFFSPDGEVLALLGTAGLISLYSLASGQWRVERLHTGYVSQGRFSPDGRFLVTSDAQGSVVVTDVSLLFGQQNGDSKLEALFPPVNGNCTE